MHRILTVDCNDLDDWTCSCPPGLAIGVGDTCVVEAEKVLDFGKITSVVTETDAPDPSLPLVLRRATLQDQARASENLLFTKSANRRCIEKLKELHLMMRLIKVRYSFDRSRLTITFSAEERVDFRQLVQDLAAETHARVEMRQIGARDVAAICGGMAPCGRSLCCAVWLKDFDNIHIRLAKTQGLSLNPSTINGMCGRLKCCLRYEQNCYRDMSSGLPSEGERVACPDGEGKVIELRVLAQKVKVYMDDRRILEFDARDVKRLGSPREKSNNPPP